MQVKVIVDYWDGRTKEAIMYPDEIPSRSLQFKMMEGDILGYSVTKYLPIMQSVEKYNKENLC